MIASSVPPATHAPTPFFDPDPNPGTAKPTNPIMSATQSEPAANAARSIQDQDQGVDDDAAAAAMATALAQVWSAHATLSDLVKTSCPISETADAVVVDRSQAVRALDAMHLLLETVITPYVVAVAEHAVTAAVDVQVASQASVTVAAAHQNQEMVDCQLDKQQDGALADDGTDLVVVPCPNSARVEDEAVEAVAFTPATESTIILGKSDADASGTTSILPLPHQPLDSPATVTHPTPDNDDAETHQHVAPAAADEDLEPTQDPNGHCSPPALAATVPVPVAMPAVDHSPQPKDDDQDDTVLLRKPSTRLRRSSTRRRNSDVRRTLVMMDLSLDRHLASLGDPEAGDRAAQDDEKAVKVPTKTQANEEPALVAQQDTCDNKDEAVQDQEETDHSDGYLHILDPTEEYDLDESIALEPPAAALDSPPPLPIATLAPTTDLHPQTPPSPASTASPAPHPDHEHEHEHDRPPTQPHSPPSSPNPTHPPLHHLTNSDDGAPRALLTSPAHVTASLASTHHTDAAVDEAMAVVSEYAEAATRSVLLRAEHEATMAAAAAVVASGSQREEKRRSLVASVASTVSPRHSMVGGGGGGAGRGGANLPPMMSASAPSMAMVTSISANDAQVPPLPAAAPQLARASTAPADPSALASPASTATAAGAPARPPSASPPSKSVGFASTVCVVTPPADSPPNPALAASKPPAGSAKRAMHALRKAIQSATTSAASAARRSRSTSPNKNVARTPYPDHPQPMVGSAAATATGAVDLTRNESTLSRRIHEADANMVRNAQIIAMAARAEEERQRERARREAHPDPDVWNAEPAPAAQVQQQQQQQQVAQPKRRSSASQPDLGMPAKQALDVLAGATPAPPAPAPAPDRFLPPSVAEQQRWSRSTISAAETAQAQQQHPPASTPIANTDRTLAPIPARSTSGASTTSSGPTPSVLSRSSSSSSARSDDSLPELWPLVELSPDRQLSLRHRAALLTSSIARDAIGYYASNEPREKWAHAHACRAGFLAWHAAPTVQMLHTAGMKVTLAQLVHALEWVGSGKGARRERMPPAPGLPEVPTPDVLQRVQRTLLGFVASFTDVGPTEGSGVGAGGMPAAIKVAGLASALFASPVVHAAAARFATSHPVVFRMLDRITALLVLARLTGLALLYPVPGAGFAGEAMVRAVPRGTRVPTSEMLRVGGASCEGDVDVEEPLPSGCEVPEGFKVQDGDEDEEENVAVGVAAASKRQKLEESSDHVGMLVFPGLVDAQGRVVSKAWVLVE